MMRLSKSCRGIQKRLEKRASPLFQAFFPLPLGFFLNQVTVFRQSQGIS